MVDSSPLKSDEQYPLLKVETGGGGDSGRTQPSVVTPGWHVAGIPKRSWLDRWPELISAFWMSGMLLGIFCLMLYGLGLGVIRRQPVLMMHCKTPKPGSDVYYHHIVQHGNAVPFSKFSEYLSYMASLYSSLHFNVIFLMDDTYPSDYRGYKHSRFLNNFMPNHFKIGEYIDENNQKEFRDFHTKHQNVNITVTTLSKYMALTPLRYKWRAIPMGYLTFYARAFSVWRRGGIGIDLETFSNQFNRRQLPDRRISEIFKQHNNGIKPDEYTNSLNNINREEQNEFASLFYGIIHQILNETRAFLNHSLLYSEASIEKDQTSVKPLVRTHRNKREFKNTAQSNNNDTKKNFTTEILEVMNTTNTTVIDIAFENIRETTNDSNISSDIKSVIPITKQTDENGNQKSMRNNFRYIRKNISEAPQILLLYDFSLISDNSMGPSYLLPEPMTQGNFSVTPSTEHGSTPDNLKQSPYILSINVEGTFLAASLKQHPFLAHISSARCQRMPPRFVIQDAMISQCSNVFRDDVYCSNIYLLY